MNSLPSISKQGKISPPWKSINFLAELNRSVNRLCKLTETPHLQVTVKVSQPVTFASDRLLIRVLLDNIVFTAIHNTAHGEVPLLDIAIWVDEIFAHLEVKREMPEKIRNRKKLPLAEHFFRSFMYERKYNFGLSRVEKAIYTLQGKMEVQQAGTELMLILHMPNQADFGHSSASAQAPVSSYQSKYN